MFTATFVPILGKWRFLREFWVTFPADSHRETNRWHLLNEEENEKDIDTTMERGWEEIAMGEKLRGHDRDGQNPLECPSWECVEFVQLESYTSGMVQQP